MKAVFVHGKKIKRNGNLHPEFINRLEKAVKLYKKQKVSLLIVSGGKTRKKFESESYLGMKFLIKQGIPAEKIETFTCVYTTIDEIEKLKTFLDKKKFEKLYIVTSSLHMFRIRLLYNGLIRNISNLVFVKTKTYDYMHYILTEIFAILYSLLFLSSGFFKPLHNLYKKAHRNV